MADTTPDSKPKSETGYLLVVCVLLVVISVALTWLWQMQKKRTERSEAAQRALIEQRQANPLAEFLAKAGRQAPPPALDPVPRNGFHQNVEVDGQPHILFRITPSEGRRLGFEPGDLILVMDDPDQPASRPAATAPAGSSSAAPSGPIVPRTSERAKKQAALTQIGSFKTALASFEVDCGRFPTTDEGLKALIEKPANAKGWGGPYLDGAIPNDPWGNPYVYRCPGTHGTDYDLFSTGPDGADTHGENINNWAPKN